MRRREFITLIGGAASWPLAARAQSGKLPTIGFLGGATPSAWSRWTAAFARRLPELGWIDGRHIFAHRAAADDLQCPRFCPSRGSHVLCAKLPGSVPSRCRIGRQDSARDKARRYPGRAADRIRARSQPDDRQGTRLDDPRIVSAARRRGNRMIRRDVIRLVGGAAVAWPLAARAQQPAMPVGR
jgi:hypothetical protein